MGLLRRALVSLTVASAAIGSSAIFIGPAFGGVYGGFNRFAPYGSFYGGGTTVIVTGRRLSESCRTILAVIKSEPDLSALASLAPSLSPSLQAALTSSDPSQPAVTLFLPNNNALASFLSMLPADVRSELPKNSTALTALLSYHTVSGNITAADLKDGQSVPTMLRGNSPPLRVSVSGQAVQIISPGSKASVVKPNLFACRGTVHIIDSVLLPMSTSEEKKSMEGGQQAPSSASKESSMGAGQQMGQGQG